MYTPWLQAAGYSPGDLPEGSFGKQLASSVAPDTQVALVGVDAQVADRVRGHLYRHFWDQGDLRVIDLGNLRKQNADFAVPLIRELHTSRILPVLLGGSIAGAASQYLAFADLNREVGVGVIDSAVRLNYGPQEVSRSAFLDRAVHRVAPPPFHLAHIGDQRHLSDPRLDGLFLQRNYERYPLGRSRADLSDLEPAIRDVDCCILNICAVLAAESPGQEFLTPSGFSLQEAGQLAYYAGNSDRLSSFGVYGYAPDQTDTHQSAVTAAAYAQLIWYFLHGVSHRHADFPATTTGLVEYVVDSKSADRFTFWRSPRSNRWWVQVPLDRHRGEERNRLVACSYADYLATSQEGRLPERLYHAFSRY